MAGAFILQRHGDDHGAMLLDLERYLEIHDERFHPQFVGFESPILLPHDTLSKLRKLYPIPAFVEWFFKKRGIPCEEVSAKTIKKEFTGNPSASKDDMVAVAIKTGIILPEEKVDGREDAADASGGWVHFQRLKDRKSIPFWDQRIYGRKGSLI